MAALSNTASQLRHSLQYSEVSTILNALTERTLKTSKQNFWFPNTAQLEMR